MHRDRFPRVAVAEGAALARGRDRTAEQLEDLVAGDVLAGTPEGDALAVQPLVQGALARHRQHMAVGAEAGHVAGVVGCRPGQGRIPRQRREALLPPGGIGEKADRFGKELWIGLGRRDGRGPPRRQRLRGPETGRRQKRCRQGHRRGECLPDPSFPYPHPVSPVIP